MNYISLYRKYRSQDFDDLVGQKHIIQTLKNAISSDRISHAYLFTGPRGTGKTSTARIFAKALNCKNGPTVSPCLKCDMCLKIRDGNAVDVIEIDAASNRGIDEIRDLREKVRYAPVEGKYKVYIIDEVHMLTAEAFNALLKTLEEPPSHVIFILATTEPQKVPITIASRCQRLDFERIKLSEIKEQLLKIAKAEKFKIDEKALDIVARSGEGSMRDSISLLDQLVSFAGDSITLDDVVTLLGAADEDMLFALSDAIHNGNDAEALELLRTGIDEGRSAAQVAKDLINHFRDLMFAKVGAAGSLELTKEYQERLSEQSNGMEMGKIKDILRALTRAELDMKWHPHARLVLEVALLEIMQPKEVQTVSAEVKRPANVVRPAATVAAIPAVKETISAPVPAAKPASPAPAGSRIAHIKTKWNEILALVKKQSPYGFVSLHEGEPMEINAGGKLVIGFKKGYAFHKERLEEAKNRAAVESAIKEVTGEEIGIEGEIMDGRPSRQAPVTADLVRDIFEGEVI
ncbi:MAG TPA: DNA polymerase III subunit gamma/tau [Candidatus Omnitrophota bacterium]|nr:DNA polymerase III subunit gamma/tau [Candidatus Omnitrophota bacterium]